MSADKPFKTHLTLMDRFVLRVLNAVFKWQLGYEGPTTEETIRTYGWRAVLVNSPKGAKLIGALEKRYGAAEAQYLIAVSGLMSGCRWCGTSHMLGANLILFHADGTLGPLDDGRIKEYEQLTDEQFIAELGRVMDNPRWRDTLRAMERLIALHSDTAEGDTEDDPMLNEVNAYWDWTTECTIQAMDWDPILIPAPVPLAKDKALIARYRAAREKAQQPAPTEP